MSVLNTFFNKLSNQISLGILSFMFVCLSLNAANPATLPPNFVPPPLPAEFEDNGQFAPGLNPNDMVGPLVLVDENVDQVFRLLEKYTGRLILKQETLPQPMLNFNSLGKLTRTEAVLAIETLLTLNGISVTSMGDKFLKAVPTSSIRFQSPEMINGSTLARPATQRHYSKVFRLKHITIEEATSIVNTLQTPGLSTQLVLKKAKALMVTDSLSNLQQIERILNEIDVTARMDAEMIFRSLNYISAMDLKDRLDNMIQGPLKNFINGDAHVEADERTNQIVLLTAKENVALIEQVINSLDVDAAPLTKTDVFYLKYAKSEEVAPILNSIVSSQSLLTDSNSAAFSRNKSSGSPVGADKKSNNRPPNSSGDTDSNDQFSPYISIEADERSNAIIVFGTSSDIRYISQLLEKVDVVLPQVKIDVIIAEVTIGDKYNRGIDSFALNLLDSKDSKNDNYQFGVNQLVDKDGKPGDAIADLPFRIIAGKTIEDFTLNTVFQTAQTDSDVSILSAPTLVTTHNMEASIQAGEKRPVITGSSTDNTGSSTRSEVTLEEIGIELKFTPLIGSDGMVQLEIEQKIESVKSSTLIDGNEQPIIGSRTATSYVSVADGEVIVLGGLQEVKTKDVKGRMFLLGGIPILGDWLFSSTREENSIQDLVIFIRPQVIYNSDDSSKMSDSFINRSSQKEKIQSYLKNDDLGGFDE